MSERCTAKSKRTHQRCRAQPIRGRDKCRHHGGKSLAGPLSPRYASGLYSKYLPARFASLLKVLEGQDALDLTGKIKVLEARLLDVMSRVDTGESGAQWKRLSMVWQKAQAAKAAHDLTTMAEALNDLGTLIMQGLADWEAWEKIEEIIVKQTRVVESQRKRAVEAHEMLAAQDARAMMRAITEGLKRAVEEHVTDDQIKRRIFIAASSEFARLVNPGRVELVSTADN